MAIVVKRSVTSGEELINGNKLDWSTMGYTYKKTDSVTFTSSATAYNRNYPSGWSMTFDAVIGGIYEVCADTSWLTGSSQELDMMVDIDSGATSIRQVSSIRTGADVSMSRHTISLITATATSVTVKLGIAVGEPSKSITIYGGLMTAKRVA